MTEIVNIKQEIVNTEDKCNSDTIENLIIKQEPLHIKEERRYETDSSSNVKQEITSDHSARNNSDDVFLCLICDNVYTNKPKLRKHISNHFLTSYMRTYIGEGPFKCDICHIVFMRNIYLLRHMRTHTGEKLHECNICRVRFSQKNIATEHTGDKPYVCDICHKRFARNSYIYNSLYLG